MKVCIVGGGSAGWMTATTFLQCLPDYEITLIESPDVPITGVGESTLAQIHDWINLVGIRECEKEFMRETNATVKHSIRFTNFLKKNSGGFHYPFGKKPLDPQVWWDRQLRFGDKSPNDYAININHIGLASERGKIDTSTALQGGGDYAYHFDAIKFGQFLKKKFCQKLRHIQGHVVNFVTTDEKNIHSVVLEDGSEVEADLFIDCTGFKSLLLGEYMGEEFYPMDHLLPNDRAWATHVPYKDKEKQMHAYTHCTAIDNGWVYDIPLWTGVGTGYVYSSKYISDDDAKQELIDHLSDKYDPSEATFKKIHMRVGRHVNTWVNNVVAIGLSAGFIEPLESNGLLLTHQPLIKLVKCLRRGKASQLIKQYYNSDVRREFDTTADFVAIHYAFTQREDTPYWKDIFEKEYNIEESLLNNGTYLNGLFGYGREIFAEGHFLNVGAGLHYVASGMNICPLDRPQMRSDIDIERINKEWEEAVKQLPSPYSYLSDLYQSPDQHQIEHPVNISQQNLQYTPS